MLLLDINYNIFELSQLSCVCYITPGLANIAQYWIFLRPVSQKSLLSTSQKVKNMPQYQSVCNSNDRNYLHLSSNKFTSFQMKSGFLSVPRKTPLKTSQSCICSPFTVIFLKVCMYDKPFTQVAVSLEKCDQCPPLSLD